MFYIKNGHKRPLNSPTNGPINIATKKSWFCAHKYQKYTIIIWDIKKYKTSEIIAIVKLFSFINNNFKLFLLN
jgi:hypothetical protein